ncbi:hypothetical protein RIF29_33226 [Crotalaria pallida]|uniref:Uncharacterized protein n=1 Tax=Crotalaria pallida TaxID=3830 RepID=A0AAN9HWP3_CROPI
MQVVVPSTNLQQQVLPFLMRICESPSSGDWKRAEQRVRQRALSGFCESIENPSLCHSSLYDSPPIHFLTSHNLPLKKASLFSLFLSSIHSRD